MQFSHQSLSKRVTLLPIFPPSFAFNPFPVDVLHRRFLLVAGKRKIAWANCWDAWCSGPHGSPQVAPSLCCKNEVIFFFFSKRPRRSERRRRNRLFSSFILERSSLHPVTCSRHIYLPKSFCSVWKGRDPDPCASKTLTLFLAYPCELAGFHLWMASYYSRYNSKKASWFCFHRNAGSQTFKKKQQQLWTQSWWSQPRFAAYMREKQNVLFYPVSRVL